MVVSEKPVRILVVDADEATRWFLRLILSKGHYEVFAVSDAEEALSRAAEYPPRLVVLDLSLALQGGQQFWKKLRSLSPAPAPVLVVSDLPPHEAKAALTELDADDYLAKPFRASAALERVRALLHPALDSRWSGPAIDIGDLRIDRLGRCAFRDGRQIDLTPTEFNLLTYLAQNADHATSSKKILQAVWGPEYGDTQTLRVHVANLRKKIEPDPAAPRYILTEPGLGYCLASANLKGGKGDRS